MRIKKLIFACFPFVFVGCSHAYIAQQDKGQITVCCPSQKIACSYGSLKEFAQKECPTNVEFIAGASHETGNVSVQRNLFNGQILGVSSDKEICSAYKCGN